MTNKKKYAGGPRIPWPKLQARIREQQEAIRKVNELIRMLPVKT